MTGIVHDAETGTPEILRRVNRVRRDGPDVVVDVDATRPSGCPAHRVG